MFDRLFLLSSFNGFFSRFDYDCVGGFVVLFELTSPDDGSMSGNMLCHRATNKLSYAQ
jgi:hypothetical protein